MVCTFKYSIIMLKMFQFLLDLLFPRHCFGCKASGQYICSSCRTRLLPSPPLEIAETVACFNYEDKIIKTAIWKLKYSGLSSLAQELSALMSENLKEDLVELATFAGQKKILVLPIPTNKNREKKRGYNQAALLAKALTKNLPEILEYRGDVLVKIKNTLPQVAVQSRSARLNNLRGAFAVNQPEAIKDRPILIIDDVTTTGATFNEARRAITASGGQTVLAAALAHKE